MDSLTPESVMLQQLDGQWQKMLTFVLWKLSPDKAVRITAADIQSLTDHFAPGAPVLCTHGHGDSFEFSIINEASARRIAAHEATQRGTA